MYIFELFLRKVNDVIFIRKIFKKIFNRISLLILLICIFSFDPIKNGFNKSIVTIFNPIMEKIGKPIENVIDSITKYKYYCNNINDIDDAMDKIRNLEYTIAIQSKELQNLKSIKEIRESNRYPNYNSYNAKVLFYENFSSKNLWAFILEKEGKPIVGSLVKGKKGLVGKVIQVIKVQNGYRARIQLISSSIFSVAAKRTDIDGLAIIKGDGENSVLIAYDFLGNNCKNSKNNYEQEDIEGEESNLKQKTNKVFLFTVSVNNSINIPELPIGEIINKAGKVQIIPFEDIYTLDYITIISPSNDSVFNDIL